MYTAQVSALNHCITPKTCPMKILFCGSDFSYATDYLAPLLTDHTFIACSDENILTHVAEADVIIPFITDINENILKNTRLGLIQQYGVGLETVDIEAATRHGVWVCRVPSAESGNADSVAEHALMLMLMLSRRYYESQKILNEGRQAGAPIGQALIGKHACIIGLGGIGKALALRLNDLGMLITGVHEYPERGVPDGVDKLFPLAELTEAVQSIDYVILSLNYTPERHHFIDEQQLGAIKAGAYLINVARGGLLNQEALLNALKQNHIAGAGLDVFWEEPVDVNHALFKQNVIATPHIAGVTDTSYEGTARAVAENIRRYAQGKKPLYAVNDPATIN